MVTIYYICGWKGCVVGMGRKWLAAFCTAVLMLTSLPVYADGQAVLYDEEAGESLTGLLTEDAEAWPTLAPVEASALDIRAKSAVLIDQGTGQVLYEKNSREHLPVASVTKVMTLLLVFEALAQGRIDWKDTVTCSNRAASMGGSQIWLEPGEIMTVEELVKAATVVSANDACAALAEHISGSIEAFVAAMNERAAALGLEDTCFKDCSGLDDSAYSCAYDLAVISRQLMTYPEVEKFTTIWMDTLRGGKSQLVNTNKLVRHYTGATGLKTGTTQAAGHCLAATARRENTAFVAVVLGCATTAERFEGARALLDHGFSAYETYLPSAEGEAIAPVKVRRGQAEQVEAVVDRPQALLLPKGAAGRVQTGVEMAEDVEAPVEEGQIVGTWRLMLDEEVLGEYPIRAKRAVPCISLRWAYQLLVAALLS